MSLVRPNYLFNSDDIKSITLKEEGSQPTFNIIFNCAPDYTFLYRPTKVLGKGLYGVVYKLDASFAGKAPTVNYPPTIVVKQYTLDINITRAGSKSYVKAAKKEAEYFKKMDGVAICYRQKKKSANEEVTLQPYILMDYVDGTLFHKYKQTCVDDIFDISLETLAVLNKIHARNMLHMDIKPDNIFICRDAEDAIKIRFIDGSLSKEIGEEVQIISPAERHLHSHLPPERFKHASSLTVDFSYDIYSAGKVLENLFNAYHGNDRLFKYFKKDIQFVLGKMTAGDPKQRISLATSANALSTLYLRYSQAKQFYDELREAEKNKSMPKISYCLIYMLRLVLDSRKEFEFGKDSVSTSKRFEKYLKNLPAKSKKLNDSDLSANIGLLVNMYANNVNCLFFSLKLLNEKNRILFLNKLNNLSENAFTNIFRKYKVFNKQELCKLIPLYKFTPFLEQFYKGKIKKIEEKQSTSWHEWLYCQMQLRDILKETPSSKLVKSWLLFNSKRYHIDETVFFAKQINCSPIDFDYVSDTSCFKQRYALGLINTLNNMIATNEFNIDFFKKANELLKKVDKKFPHKNSELSAAIDRLMDAVVKKMWEKYNNKKCSLFSIFKPSPLECVLKEADKFKEENDFYIELLLASNRLYGDKRAQGKKYYTIFGKYSREVKLFESQRLGVIIRQKGSLDNVSKAAEEGSLNLITSRYRNTLNR